MTALYVYRLDVTSWPTSDGQPWARFYGDTAAAPNDEIPDWLAPLLDQAKTYAYRYNDRTPLGRIGDRLKIQDETDEIVGVLMPKVSRRHYLSASGAHEVARDMRAFGAVVTVQRSGAITAWCDVESGEVIA